MKYTKTVNIWALSIDQIKALPIGQWVCAGDTTDQYNKGRFYGVKPSGTIVVAWLGNARGRYKQYNKALHQYGKA